MKIFVFSFITYDDKNLTMSISDDYIFKNYFKEGKTRDKIRENNFGPENLDFREFCRCFVDCMNNIGDNFETLEKLHQEGFHIIDNLNPDITICYTGRGWFIVNDLVSLAGVLNIINIKNNREVYHI